MKRLFLFLCFLSLLQIEPATAQSSHFNTEQFNRNINDKDKFSMYLDSINKYLYRDDKIVIEAIDACESIFQNSNQLDNEDLLKFVTQKIYYEQKRNKYLECYKLVSNHNHLLNNDNISDKTKEHFIYIKGYTFMTLSDLEEAQKTYYNLYEKGQSKRDTGLITMSLYSIGQIYNEEKEYESAIQTLTQLKELQKKVVEKNYTTIYLTDYELIEAFLSTKQYDKAEELSQVALNRLDTIKIESFKPDFLLYKGEIALAKGNISTAKKVIEEVQQILRKAPDPMTSNNAQLLYAKILAEQEDYESAIRIYESLISNLDTTSLGVQLSIYEKAKDICYKMGDNSKAYKYSQQYIDVNKKITKKEKQAHTSYLKVKFETEQKEKENKLLAIQVHHKQSENKFLSILFFISSLGILGLFWAFYQKKKYNQRLQDEVKRQTKELKLTNTKLVTTNKELDEFNKILSHDLKEPLRSIVGFSSLLRKQIQPSVKAIEYINFIEKGGQQLNSILDDVSVFQSVKQLDTNDLNLEGLDTELMVKDLTKIIQENKPNQKIIISHSKLPSIFSYKNLLKLVFENLITNGINFNKSETPQIDIRHFEKDAFHYFEFEDNGIGIAPQFIDKVFGMFKRLNNRTVHNGSGLGLNISKKILEQLGGDISIVSSTEGKGTIFQIYFPIIKSSSKDYPVESPAFEIIEN